MPTKVLTLELDSLFEPICWVKFSCRKFYVIAPGVDGLFRSTEAALQRFMGRRRSVDQSEPCVLQPPSATFG